jgi:hypothetical protein
VVNDDDYSDRVINAARKLLGEHKLVPLDSLRGRVRPKGFAFKEVPLLHAKLDPPDLCERLRRSTFAVGTFYKCPDCGAWHFSSSSGFVVSDDGILCTCCHVITAQDEDLKEAYLIAADSNGHVYPVISVVAADTEADTCLIRINATELKPLPLRAGVRAGEQVYCLSHPGGYFFMFTQGMVARINQRTMTDTDAKGHPNGALSRPILLLNITAEFAPGSSGAPVVDLAGNVVGQVASIADAGETTADDENQAPSPSVPVRFCTATEEILRLGNPALVRESHGRALKPVKSRRQKSTPAQQ